MRIRSITYFIDPTLPSAEALFDLIANHKNTLKKELENAGYEIQTIRLATSPVPHWIKKKSQGYPEIMHLLEQTSAMGFDYLSLGAYRSESIDMDALPEILTLAPIVFMSVHIADMKQGIVLKDIESCAHAIKEVALLEPNGFANLRLAALANVEPFTPFFPAAYGMPGECAFSIAVECADEAVKSFQQAENIATGCQNLCSTFEKNATKMEKMFERNSLHSQIPFKGFDFSLAPYPEDWCSFGKALEAMGVAAIGSAGSLAAAAILAGALDSGTWQKAGFNGLMMPILEDSILAQRSSQGILSVYDVLQYSSICGTGLDTVPLPGDIQEEKIRAILLDIAALALRLNKPLTARLMPIPHKIAGDVVDFDFSYFAKGKVLDFPYEGVGAPLTSGNTLKIISRC